MHRQTHILAHMQKVSGGYIGGVPPVPIPNTEVKPSRADGTAWFPCGRVGRCRNFIRSTDAPPRDHTRRGASSFLVPAETNSPRGQLLTFREVLYPVARVAYCCKSVPGIGTSSSQVILIGRLPAWLL
jgi:hypothetical protein